MEKNIRERENRQDDQFDAAQYENRSTDGRTRTTDDDDDDDYHYRGYYQQSRSPFRSRRGSGELYVESWVLAGPYSGRGPKGYTRSDEQILEEACRRLEQDGAVDASDIEVSCDDGIVSLRGTVEDRRTKRHAEDCVASVYGVKDVMNELRVKPSDEPEAKRETKRETEGQRGRPESR
jgi:hypothetical protein